MEVVAIGEGTKRFHQMVTKCHPIYHSSLCLLAWYGNSQMVLLHPLK